MKNKKAILLVSGGIDSPVAGHIMKEKFGLEIVAVHFSNRSETDEREEKKVAALMRKIGVKKIYFVDNTYYQKAFREKDTNPRLTCILCKRFMFRIAQEIAHREDAGYLITGENLGQVASQTLINISVNDSVIEHEHYMVLRPLLGMDKEETIKIARDIGTFDISIGKSTPCTWLPKDPATASSKEKLELQEKRLDIANILQHAIKSCRIEHN